MCNKIAYPSKAEATKDAQLIMHGMKKFSNRTKPRTKRLRPYFCWYCDQWHLTSQKPRKYNATRKSRQQSKRNSERLS